MTRGRCVLYSLWGIQYNLKSRLNHRVDRRHNSLILLLCELWGFTRIRLTTSVSTCYVPHLDTRVCTVHILFGQFWMSVDQNHTIWRACSTSRVSCTCMLLFCLELEFPIYFFTCCTPHEFTHAFLFCDAFTCIWFPLQHNMNVILVIGYHSDCIRLLWIIYDYFELTAMRFNLWRLTTLCYELIFKWHIL